MDATALTCALKEEALRLGFDLAGVCPAVAPPHLAAFHAWLAAGRAGRMDWMAGRAEAYAHPRHVLEDAASLLVLAVNYRTVEPQEAGPGQGQVSRYAWGDDYHDVIRDRLHRLADFHRNLVPTARVRGVVDTAPLLERDYAQLAGLGWIGKNTLLLHPELGSWLFLAVLLTSEELVADEPFGHDRCGTCRACLDACPTGALTEAYQLDARCCISYWTIESQQAVPEALRSDFSAWVFGCDACQEVCPWNRRTPASDEPAFRPRPDTHPLDLAGLLALDEAGFRARFGGTPLARARRAGLLRSAAVALGNRPHAAAREALLEGTRDQDPAVREACTWALSGRTDAAESGSA